MADPIVTPQELLSKLAEGREFDFFREAMLAVLREFMEIEVAGKTGATHGERTPERLTMRNGYRERRLDTRVGSLCLPIPKLREGTYFPSFLKPRRRSEEALVAVITEAYVKGVSTREVEDLAQRGSTASPKVRSPVSAAAWMSRWRPSGAGRFSGATPTSSWTPPTRRCGTSRAGWSPWPWSLPTGWRRPASGRW